MAIKEYDALKYKILKENQEYWDRIEEGAIRHAYEQKLKVNQKPKEVDFEEILETLDDVEW